MRANIPKLILLNGHGGNNFRQILRELSAEFESIWLCTINWYDIASWDRFFEADGDHAGEAETSIIQHLLPHLVKPLSEAGSGRSKKPKLAAMREGWAWTQRPWSTVTEDTGVGDPGRASAEKGEQFMEACISPLSQFLIELADTPVGELYA